MAFRFRGRHAIILSVVVVIVLAVVFYLINSPEPSDLNPSNQSSQPSVNDNGGNSPQNLSNQNGNITSTPNETRFVDTVTKISAQTNKDKIQRSLDEHGYSPISATVDTFENLDAILSSFSKNEFQLEYRGSVSPVFYGNATQLVIAKLQENSHVIKIYYYGEPVGKSALDLQNTTEIINANGAWNLLANALNITGYNVTICVVDTGVNYTHPDLGNCSQTSNITSANCSKVIGGKDFGLLGYTDEDPMDTDGHGTHVAGIIAANGKIRGVAPDAKLVVVRANPASIPILEQGVRWCLDHRNAFSPPIKIISLSASSDELYQGICDGVDDIVDTANEALPNDTLMIASTGNAGNSTAIGYPACGSNVTSVGGSTKLIGMEDYAATEWNRNNFTDLLAPSKSINSTGLPYASGCNYTSGQLYQICEGTSQAVPHVAGAAALLLQLKSDLTPGQIVSVLNVTGKNITYASPTSATFKRIDAYKAISAVNDSLLRVNTLSVINYSGLSHFFAFTIQNANLSNITNISWSADMGDGTVINSTYNITQLLYHETALVRLKHNYSSNGIYIVNVSTRAGNLIHSKNITVYVGDLIVYDLKTINASGWQRTFQFTVRNNREVNFTALNWTVYFGDGINTSANQLNTLEAKKELFLRIRYNYTAPSPTGVGYIVNATGTNGTLIDSQNITITVA